MKNQEASQKAEVHGKDVSKSSAVLIVVPIIGALCTMIVGIAPLYVGAKNPPPLPASSPAASTGGTFIRIVENPVAYWQSGCAAMRAGARILSGAQPAPISRSTGMTSGQSSVGPSPMQPACNAGATPSTAASAPQLLGRRAENISFLNGGKWSPGASSVSRTLKFYMFLSVTPINSGAGSAASGAQADAKAATMNMALSRGAAPVCGATINTRTAMPGGNGSFYLKTTCIDELPPGINPVYSAVIQTDGVTANDARAESIDAAKSE